MNSRQYLYTTSEEKKRFRRAVASGHGPARDIPPGPETPLSSINKLSATEPSPLLAVHLLDIIDTYCFTLRLYNGDWLSDPAGSAMVMLSVSSVLGEGGQPESVSEALSHCLEQTCSPAFRHTAGLQFGLGLLDDVIALLSLGGPGEVWSLMAAIANAEKGSVMEFAGSKGATLRMQNKVEARGKALIEELE
ncbi:hypothetical protein Vadar_020142 [Vaccinium darrowii]|uniref:Uncharacterized protein n=1 Tax=Vaccinium darrowii TaxID=229202 RepID=A0ACB7Y147_9ERIC|nr:hypothetical protein Vadar_020142 [Vaccinium darrowii]